MNEFFEKLLIINIMTMTAMNVMMMMMLMMMVMMIMNNDDDDLMKLMMQLIVLVVVVLFCPVGERPTFVSLLKTFLC